MPVRNHAVSWDDVYFATELDGLPCTNRAEERIRSNGMVGDSRAKRRKARTSSSVP